MSQVKFSAFSCFSIKILSLNLQESSFVSCQAVPVKIIIIIWKDLSGQILLWFMYPGLAPLNHVLFPRYKAMQLCLDRLRPSTQAVYDVTVAYSNTKQPDNGVRLTSPGLPCEYTISPDTASLLL